MITENERKKMLKLARSAIIFHDDEEKLKRILNSTKIKGESGVFVSVYVKEDLRGCIGNLNSIDLKEGIATYAVMAAHGDHRFDPIEKKELLSMKIHINLLSEPKEIFPANAFELLKILESKPGLMIEKNYRGATFLPSVWEQLPNKEEFMNHLCIKAGLPAEEWKKPGMSFHVYSSEEFSE